MLLLGDLLRFQADLLGVDSNGATALSLASFCGYEKCVNAILGRGNGREAEEIKEDVSTSPLLNLRDSTGATPLWLACSKVVLSVFFSDVLLINNFANSLRGGWE